MDWKVNLPSIKNHFSLNNRHERFRPLGYNESKVVDPSRRMCHHEWSEEINCNTLNEKGLNLQYQL